MNHAPPYLSSPESNASLVLEECPVELAHFEDKLNVVQTKINNSDTVTRNAKALLKSMLLHLGVSQGAWSYMDTAPEVELEKLADHIRVAVLIPCRVPLLMFGIWS